MNSMGDSIAERVGCLHVDNATATISCIREKPAVAIMAASTFDTTSFQHKSLDGNTLGSALYWSPMIDGVHINGTVLDVVSDPTPDVKERLQKMSFIVGNSEDEMGFFTGPVTLNGRAGNVFFYMGKGRSSLGDLFNTTAIARTFRKMFNRTRREDEDGVESSTVTDPRDMEAHGVRLYRNLIAQSFANGSLFDARVEAIMNLYPPRSGDSRHNIETMKEILNDYLFKCSARKVGQF